MKLLRKSRIRRSPPGLERVILKKLPMYLVGGTLVPLFMALLARLQPFTDAMADVAKHQMSIDILAVAIVITVWTAVFTIAIGCFIVWIMKGPEYTADSYKLEDSERPRQGPPDT